MQVKFKKLNSRAVIPTYAKQGDAGLDLTAIYYYFMDDDKVVYQFGLAFEIPDGYYGQLTPRSSICKYDLELVNSVGIIDSQFRGDVTAVFRLTKKDEAKIYNVGERVAQLIIMPYPKVKLIEVDELSDTERGANGYGSTGK